MSGYLFCFLKYEKGKYEKWWPFIINKAKRLLVPYAFVSIIWVIPLSQPFFLWDAKTIVYKYLLGTAPSQLWFLLMLFCVFMLCYLLSDFFRKHTIYGAIVIMLIYGVGLIGKTAAPNYLQMFTACSYMPLFWIGFKMRQYGSEELHRLHPLVWIAGYLIIFVVTSYVQRFDGLFFTLLHLGLRFLLNVVGASMAFVILQKLANRIRWKESEVFKCLSKNAMAIYLFHQQVIYLFIHWLNGMVNPYIHAVINFLGSLAISLLISSLLMKFKLTRALVGEK